MIPKIFHLTAPSKTLSWEERKVMARLERLLPDWSGHLWDDADNSVLMRENFPHLAERFEAIKFGVMKADIARCAYMHVHGGFYFDTDYKLLKPIDDAMLRATLVLPIEEGGVGAPDFKIGNAVFGSAKGHAFWGDFINYIFEEHAPQTLTEHRKIPVISGPRGMTNFYLAHKDKYPDAQFPPQNEFHPERTWFGLSHRGGKETYGSHLCWASWRGKTPLHATTNYVRRKLTAPM